MIFTSEGSRSLSHIYMYDKYVYIYDIYMINVYYTFFLHSSIQFKKSSSKLLDSVGESEGEMI